MPTTTTTSVPFSFGNKDERELWKSAVLVGLSDCLNFTQGKTSQGCSHLAVEAADEVVQAYRQRIEKQ